MRALEIQLNYVIKIKPHLEFPSQANLLININNFRIM